jgi:hypothetical protein
MFALLTSLQASLPFSFSPSGSPVVDAELRDAAAALTIEPAVSPRRRQLINQILSTNHSATYSFLEQFDDAELDLYARHLDIINGPRDRTSGWCRPAGTPAFCGAVAAM